MSAMILTSQVQNKEGVLLKMDKYQGRKLTADGLMEALESYLQCGNETVSYFLNQLKNLLRVVQGENQLRLFSSSLLFVFESDATAAPKCDLRFIDFGHAYIDAEHHAGPDQGAILGLTFLIDAFQQILARRSS
jgi:hypothetical protein